MKLKVMSLNVWNYHEWDSRKKNLIAFIKSENPDIILFQEINDDTRFNNPRDANLLIQINSCLNYEFEDSFFTTTFDARNNPKLGNHTFTQGLGVLSRAKITSKRKFKLTKNPEDKYSRGCFLFEIKGFTIPFVNLHFSNRTNFALDHFSECVRLIERLGVTPVYCGDFNLFKDDFSKLELPEGYTSPFLDDAYISYPSENQTFDYLLLPSSSKLISFSCHAVEVSDHRPLVFEISDE